MSDSNYTWGFCPNCLINVPHFRVVDGAVMRTIDALSRKQLESLRVGPWYCVQCETRSLLLRKEKGDAPRFESEFLDELNARSGDKSVSDQEPEFEPAGNFIKGEQSLVNQSSRLMRFTQNYRDSIVRRLLTGGSTIAQIRQEKNISEAELIAWISDLLIRQETKIEALEQVIEGPADIHKIGDDSIHQASDSESHLLPDGPTIEGQIRPK